MLLDRIVTTLGTVSATRSRLAKIDALANLLRDLGSEEIAPTVGFVLGRPRQGRWASAGAAHGRRSERRRPSRR